ncbi:hypothetical protein EBX31_09180 [bacterium]|nr:hypothetical protein [bacterium]
MASRLVWEPRRGRRPAEAARKFSWFPCEDRLAAWEQPLVLQVRLPGRQARLEQLPHQAVWEAEAPQEPREALVKRARLEQPEQVVWAWKEAPSAWSPF